MGLNAKKWRSWGVSTIGPQHARAGLPNQDAWLARRYAWGNVLAVSDGLGSRPRSHVGARAACRAVAAAARITQRGSATHVPRLLSLVHALWAGSIDADDLGDFSATCLFALRCRGRMLLAQLGDGLVAACRRDGEVILISELKEDSFSNITSCLGSQHEPQSWRTAELAAEECQAVLLMTDGISDDLLPEMQVDFVREVHATHRDLSPGYRGKELRRWLGAWPVPGHADDKTIACVFSDGGCQ